MDIFNLPESTAPKSSSYRPDYEIKASILLVDDHRPNLIALEAILSDPSYDLVVALSASEALGYIEKKEFAVILSDIRMPVMDGFEFARRIKKVSLAKETPIIFLTAETEDANQIFKAYAAGVVDYLCKPFNPDVVRSKVAIFARMFQQRVQIAQISRQIEKKKIEEHIRLSEERFRIMVEQVKDYGIITTDQKGKVTDWNPTIERITGFSYQEMIGQSLAILFTPEDREKHVFETELQQASEKESSEDVRWHLRKDGSRFWASGFTNALRNEDGSLRGFSKILRDETLQKREDDARKILSGFTARVAGSMDYKTLMQFIVDAFVPELADRCVVDIRDRGENSRHELIKHVDCHMEQHLRATRSFYPPGANSLHPVKEVLQGGKATLVPEVTDSYMRAVAKDEKHFEMLKKLGCETSIIVPLMAHGASFGTITVGASRRRSYDKEDLQLAEEVSRRGGLALDNARLYAEAMEANRLKDEFIAAISHELRTPLNAIVGHSELLMDGFNSPEEVTESIEAIHRNARAQFRLVEDLLDMSSIVSGKIRLRIARFNLAEKISESIAAVRVPAQKKDITVGFAMEDEMEPVVLDPDRIQQVIWNLLSNAVKFTPNGGEVMVSARRSGDNIQIEVKDTGGGIEPSFLPYVFDRFRQEDGTLTRLSGGLGLGLAIARQMVELHGGRIEAHSDGKGKGAMFRITLPSSVAKLESVH